MYFIETNEEKQQSGSKIRYKNFFPVLFYVLSVSALFIFLYGFFPVKYSSKSITYRTLSKRHGGQRYIDKLAFIVIDALRYDFVVPDGGQKYMPFTLSSILENKSCSIVTRAHSPTVTLPRLKAITSGSVSSYIDVILNFMTPAFKEDNFVKNAVSDGLRLVFYGDDTWLKLFPDSFIRSEGTNSFFTYDYVEVDDNVTRHIDEELKRKDWDIIILHYLGLDHIGHTEGPNSVLVKPKLLEMDNVVKQFHQHFQALEEKLGLRTMLIVTGDHGMKDSGSHGGITHSEIIVPLVSIGNPCVDLPGWPKDYIPLQVDIAPTLSAAFGLPIPGNSMGKIIPSLLHSMNRGKILEHLEINRLELLNKFKSTSGVVTESDNIRNELELWLLNNVTNEETGKNLTTKYFQTLNEMSQKLVSSNSDIQLLLLIVGVLLLWVCTIKLVLELPNQCPKPVSLIHWFFLIGTGLHALSLISSSFIEEEHQTWYFFWATFCVLSFFDAFSTARNLPKIEKIKFFSYWIILTAVHRILRKLNQTGDKWALLPDIKFYLHSEGQNKLCLVFLLGMFISYAATQIYLCLGIGMVFLCAALEKCELSQLVSYGISLLAAISYRNATGSIKLPLLSFTSRGLSEAFVFWIFFSLFTLQTIYNQTPLYLVWLALNSLLLRPHNVILLPIQVFASKRLHKLFPKSEDLFWNNIAHIWLGNVFYFYQGNGNSLSNVDVAAGFVGAQSYQPINAGIKIIAHTFNSHILSFLLSPKLDLVFALSRILPLTLYCTALIFLINHLFIWSVFSPKLLYDSCTTVLFLYLLLLNHVLKFLKSALT